MYAFAHVRTRVCARIAHVYACTDARVRTCMPSGLWLRKFRKASEGLGRFPQLAECLRHACGVLAVCVGRGGGGGGGVGAAQVCGRLGNGSGACVRATFGGVVCVSRERGHAE